MRAAAPRATEPGHAASTAAEHGLGRFGALGTVELARVRQDAWAQVIEPCLAALARRRCIGNGERAAVLSRHIPAQRS